MGAIAQVVAGGTPSTQDPANFGGDVSWLTPADLSGFEAKYVSRGTRQLTQRGLERSSATVIPSGSVLFTSRAPIGYVAIAANPVSTNQGFKNFVLEPSMVPSYCYYYLISARELAHDLASGTTFLELSAKSARQIPIPIAPKEEQKRIADVLDLLFDDVATGIDSMERCREKLHRYRASVLKAAVEGDLTADWRSEHPDAEPASELLQRILAERRAHWEKEQLDTYAEKGRTPPKNWRAKYRGPVSPDTDLPSLPASWVWATLDQIAALGKHALTDGPFGSNLKTAHYTASGPRVIRLQNIGDGEFLDAEAHIGDAHFQTLRKYEAKAGDIVFAALGYNLPRSCIVPEGLGLAIVKADCVRFRPSPLMSKECISSFVNAEPTRQRAKTLIHGVGRPRLNLRSLRTVALPIPPLEEQQEIADRIRDELAAIHEAETALTDGLSHATNLRQSILHQAFTGKLLPQDPNDEPASKLIERIGKVTSA